MDEPLGNAIGNALEVKEAIATLHGEGPADLLELCLVLGSEVMVAAGAVASRDAARRRLRQTIDDGSAFQKLCDLVAGLGGDVDALRVPDRLPRAPLVMDVLSERSGYVAGIDALACGLAAMQSGAGRAAKTDTIDPAVGIVLRAKSGDYVEQGQPLFTIHAPGPVAEQSPTGQGAPEWTGSPRYQNLPGRLIDAVDRVRAAFRWSDTPVDRPRLILDTIRG